MSKETSSTIFKKLVNSPVGIIAEFFVNKLASENGYEPLRNYFLEIQTGKTPPMSNPEYYASNDIGWIKPSDIGFDKFIIASDWISNKAVNENKATIYKPNTVLIICIGGGIGRLGIVDKICSSNQQITGILFKNEVLADFVYYFFLSRYKIFEENSSKSTLPIINQKGLGSLDFTCPKVSVQKEVIRFLEYCKECLNDFSCPTNSDFELSSEILDFSNKAFKAFYTQRSLLTEYENQLTQLENLNQAILQEAVQGKLVKQDPKDEPASELLKRIKAEKAKSSKKEKPLPPIKPEEIPFDIPENWMWCRLGDAGYLKRGKSKHRPRNDSRLFDGGNFPFIQTGDVSKAKNNNDLITTINGFYNEFGLAQSEIQPKGTLCITIAANIAECGFLDFDACVPDSIVCFQAIDKETEVYVYHYFKLAKADLERFAPATAQKNINLGILNDLPIPLPPLSEQKRIVVEIEKQLAKTKQLKEHIIANQQATEQLLKALLHQAFEVREMETV